MMVFDAIRRFFAHIWGSLCALFSLVTFGYFKEAPMPDPEAGVKVVPTSDTDMNDREALAACGSMSFETVKLEAVAQFMHENAQFMKNNNAKFMHSNNFFVPADVVEYTSTGRIRPKRRPTPDDNYTQYNPSSSSKRASVPPRPESRPYIDDILQEFPPAPYHYPSHLNVPIALEGEDPNAVLLKYLQGLADDGPYPASVISDKASMSSAPSKRFSASSSTSRTSKEESEEEKAVKAQVMKQLKRASLTIGYGQTAPEPLPAYVTEGLAARVQHSRGGSQPVVARAQFQPQPSPLAAPVVAPVVAPVLDAAPVAAAACAPVPVAAPTVAAPPAPAPSADEDPDIPWTETDESVLAFRASVISFRSSGSDYHAAADARDQLILDLDFGVPRQPATPFAERRKSLLNNDDLMARIAQPTLPLRIVKKNTKPSPLATAPVVLPKPVAEVVAPKVVKTETKPKFTREEIDQARAEIEIYEREWNHEVERALQQFRDAEANDEAFGDIFYGTSSFVSQSTVLCNGSGPVKAATQDDETCTDNGSELNDVTPQLKEDSFETGEPTGDDSVIFNMLDDDEDDVVQTPGLESAPVVTIVEDQVTNDTYPVPCEATVLPTHENVAKPNNTKEVAPTVASASYEAWATHHEATAHDAQHGLYDSYCGLAI